MQKGQTGTFILIGVLILAVIAGGAYLFFKNTGLMSQDKIKNLKPAKVYRSQYDAVKPGRSFKRYTDSTYGWSISYPEGMTLDTNLNARELLGLDALSLVKFSENTIDENNNIIGRTEVIVGILEQPDNISLRDYAEARSSPKPSEITRESFINLSFNDMPAYEANMRGAKVSTYLFFEHPKEKGKIFWIVSSFNGPEASYFEQMAHFVDSIGFTQ